MAGHPAATARRRATSVGGGGGAPWETSVRMSSSGGRERGEFGSQLVDGASGARREPPPAATPRDAPAPARGMSNPRSQVLQQQQQRRLPKIKLSQLLQNTTAAFDPNKLRISVVDKRLSVIDEVPAAYRPLQRLYMSHNCVSSLAPLAQFPALRLLSAGGGLASDIARHIIDTHFEISF